MYEKTLPVGSVVIMKGGNKRVMIIGYYQVSADDNSKIYDYAGVGFPEGFLSSDALALFNHSDIEKIYSIGYQDEDRDEFEQKLLSAIEESDNRLGRNS